MTAMTMGNPRRCLLEGEGAGCAVGDDDVEVETDELGRERGQAIVSALRPPELDGDVPALNVPVLPEPKSGGLDLALETIGGANAQAGIVTSSPPLPLTRIGDTRRSCGASAADPASA
jgi:hypothetical protein